MASPRVIDAITSVDQIVLNITTQFRHHSATTTKSKICEILGAITDIAMLAPAMQDPAVRHAVDSRIFKDVCAALDIPQCPANEILDLLSCCCPCASSKWWCFS
jgi:hypothetical protein